MIDLSIDLETFATGPGASIAQIGGASDDGDRFLVNVSDPGGEFDPQTIRWHLQQDADTAGTNHSAEDLPLALHKLATWLSRKGAHQDGECRIWTHATFDMPILESAYRRSMIRRPWHYRNCRDLRTLYDLAGGRPKIKNTQKHNAASDALAQLFEVEECYRILELRQAATDQLG